MQLHESEKIMDLSTYPYKELPYKTPELVVEEKSDGTITLRSAIPMLALEKSVPHLFKRQAKNFPDRVWLAEKGTDGKWIKCTYQAFDEQSDNIAQWLLNQGMNEKTSMVILSENSISHGLMIMGAMKAKVPVSSISAQYSLMDKSLKKLSAVIKTLAPKVVFAQCGDRYEHALASVRQNDCFVVTDNNTRAQDISLSSLLSTRVSADVVTTLNGISGETIAKYMFTSGSTGKPKCVVQTQEILCAQIAGIKSILKNPNDISTSPISLQWMPWSHVSAGNIAYNEAMLLGGAIYIDDGKPIPGLFDKTLDNLKTLSTTVFGSAPLGLSWLATALENDAVLQKVFFKKLEAIAYGGSALPSDVAQRIQRLAVYNIGKRIPIISMYGATETQGVTGTYWATDLPGVIGLPMPGMQVKLVPTGNKLAIRAKGPTVLSNYYQEPELTRDSFDEQGFFKLGDAAKFADSENKSNGLVFDGRVGEDFKLLSGTWVSNITVKANLMQALGSLVRDVVVCGENREFITVFAWLDNRAAQDYIKKNNSGESAESNIADDPILGNELTRCLKEYNGSNKGSSKTIKTIMFLKEPPSINLGEINEKGYINRQKVINNRIALLDELYQVGHATGIIHEANV